MRQIDVLIMFENKNREYESALLLKRILSDRGITSAIVQNQWSERIARCKYSPKVIVTPWCYDDVDFGYFASYKGAFPGGKFNLVNLHCEQMVYKAAIDYYVPRGNASRIYHCAWGPYYANQLLDSGIDESLVTITGSPRLDFFKREFATTQRGDLADVYGLDPTKKWILIVGNFSSAFIADVDKDKLEKRGLDNLTAKKQRAAEAYSGVLDWVAVLCQDKEISGKAQIIYRPHPSELITDRLVALTGLYPCLKVTKDLSIREWFQVCDIAFTWCSTSSVEAVCAGIPIVALRPTEIPENEQIELVEKLDQLTSAEEMREVALSCVRGGEVSTSPEFIAGIGEFFSIEQRLATARTADLVERCLSETDFLVGDRHGAIAGQIQRTAKYAVKTVLLKTGQLGRIERFRGQMDNLVSAEEAARYTRIVDGYTLSESMVDGADK